MKYEGRHSEENRLKILNIILDKEYIFLNKDYDYLDHYLSESTDGYTQLTKKNKKIFREKFLMSTPDHMMAEVYSFGWSESGVRITFYEYIDEHIDEIEAMMDSIQYIDRD